MRLPKITIEYQEEESYALGDVSAPLIVGFAAHWAWVYLFMFNGGQLFAPFYPGLQDVLFLTSIVFFSITLVSYGVFLEYARKLFGTAARRSRIRLVAAIAVFAAVLLFVASTVVPSGVQVLTVASGALCGVGSAVLLMSFAVSFSVCDLPTVAVSIAVAVPVGAVGFALVMVGEYMVPGVGGIACLALPFAECACLGACSKQLVDNLRFGSLTIPVKTRPFALHVCLPCMVFGLLLGIVSVHSLANTVSESVAEAMAAIAASGVLSGLVLVCALLTQRKSNNFAFRTLLPVVAVLIAVGAVAPWARTVAVSTFIMFGVYSLLSICIWIMCSDISQRFRISAFTAFGFGWGMMSVGMTIGVALSMSVAPFDSLVTDQTRFMALSLVVITLGWALLPSNSELRRALKLGTHCPALVADDDYAIDMLRDQNVALAADPNARVSSAVDSVPDGLGQAAARAVGGSRAIDSAAPRVPDSALDSLVSAGEALDSGSLEAQDGPSARAPHAEMEPAPRADSPEPASETPEPAALADAHGDDSTPAGTVGDSASCADSEENRRHAMGRFKRKCSAVAARFMLSRKETEVMFLLAKGYKSAKIQETLFISEGTANTHMRHIYRKLDVHSQRELMDMVDAEIVSDEGF